MRDPESEEAKQLLSEAAATGEGELVVDEAEDRLPDVLPWWEKDQLESDEGDLDGEDRVAPYASEPDMVDETILAGIDPPKETAIKLAYNAVAIW